MGLSEGGKAVLLELLEARDKAGVEDDTSWERHEWASAIEQMIVTAFQAAREVRHAVGKTKNAPPGRFGTPWAKLPVLLGRALGSAMRAWKKGDRLEFAASLLMMAAQLLLAVEELPIWMPPEIGLAAETKAVKEYVHSLSQREMPRSRVLN